MYLDAAKKQEIFSKYGKSNTDTGSAESQIALFSYRIARLTEHLKLNRKDYSTERALTMREGVGLAQVIRLLASRQKERNLHRFLFFYVLFEIFYTPHGINLCILVPVKNRFLSC